MAKKVYEENKISAIAAAIREKTGGVTTYTTAEMPSGINAVYKAGRDAMLDKLWDNIQDNGTRTDYGYFFMEWDADVFYPKYDLNLASSTMHGSYANVGIFRGFNKNGNADFDLSARLEECGVTLDTSQVKSFQYFMHTINTTRIPAIDLSLAENCYMAFYYTKIKTMDKLIFSEKTGLAANTFQYNSRFTTITEIEGIIAKSINFQHSPLDVPTMNRIIEHLKVQSSGTYTLTLKADRQNMLTDAEKAVATNKGWTLVWS